MEGEREKLQKAINEQYTLEHKAISRHEIEVFLGRGAELAKKHELAKTLKDGGVLVFPHIGVIDCAHQVAACVHAALDSGCKKVLVISVLHAFSEELETARQEVAAGANPHNYACRGIQTENGSRKEWQKDHALMTWRMLWAAEVKRRELKNPPKVYEVYPYLAGGKPQTLEGIEELKELAEDAAIVSTADAFHHGIGYGDSAEQAFWPDSEGLSKAKEIVLAGAKLLEDGDYWGYNQHCVSAKSDARDAGQVFRYIRGPLKAEVLDLSYTDASAVYNSPPPTWVLGALFRWTKL